MIDDTYKNAFKEVYDILENTEEELISKIPNKFIEFIKDNMNVDYKTNIQKDVEIDKQQLLKETEAILSLIYRSYWVTDEEKMIFEKKDREELIINEQKKKELYKDIDEIFEKRRNINKVTVDNNLMVIKKENVIKRFFKKLINIFKMK